MKVRDCCLGIGFEISEDIKQEGGRFANEEVDEWFKELALVIKTIVQDFEVGEPIPLEIIHSNIENFEQLKVFNKSLDKRNSDPDKLH